jgi:hypothetical protein
LLKASKGLADKLDALEGRIHNTKAEIPYDILGTRGGARVYSQLCNTFFTVAGGEGAPTQGMREAFEEQSREVKERETELAALIGELAKLNEAARKADLPVIVLPRVPRE